MPDKKHPAFRSIDELFSTEAERNESRREKVVQLPLSELQPFKDHPFHVIDDDAMASTVESVREYGVIVPILVRPMIDGGYEIVSGHRRHHASELAGKDTIPAIVREMSDDEAIIVMVDSNLQRETILPSEKAFAYKMKMEAMKRQGARRDLTCAQFDHKLSGAKTRDLIGEKSGDSGPQVQRYIRLTNLIPELLGEVDDRHIALSPAVELSYLPETEQYMLLSAIDYAQATPSLKQAKRIKQFSQEGKLTQESLEAIMTEERAEEKETITLPYKRVHQIIGKYFKGSPEEISNEILSILEKWARARERRQER